MGQPVPRLDSARSSRRHPRCLGNRRGAALSPPLPPPSAPLASEGSSPPPSASAEPGGLECGVPGGSGPRARLSRLLPAWPGRRAGGGRPGGSGGGRSGAGPGRRGFVSFVPGGGSAAAGGAGGGRSFPPLGLRVTAAAPPDPPPGGGGAGCGGRTREGGGRRARRFRTRSGRRPPRRARPAGPGRVVSAGPGAGRWGRGDASPGWTGLEPRCRRAEAARGEWWAASILRVGTTLLRAKGNSGGSACNAIGRQRRWSRSSAPPPRRRRLSRGPAGLFPALQDHWGGPCPGQGGGRRVGEEQQGGPGFPSAVAALPGGTRRG